MADSALAALLRRDRVIVLAALLAITVLAWTRVLQLARSMSAMAAMPGMTLDAWTPGHGATMFAMWTIMMIGMMTPSVTPMILIYAQVARRHTGTMPFASALWFTDGYLLAWTGFSLVATVTQWGLERLAMLSPMMATTNRILGGLLLIAAGAYQWLPVKYACLSRCRSPLSFVMQHGGFQAHALGSVRLGLQHGLYCIGCCWALMALLFVGGVMNLLWIAALMVFVLLEKLVPGYRAVAKASGAAAVALGVWYLVN